MSSAAIYTPVDSVFAVPEDGPFSSSMDRRVAFLRAEAQHFFHPETAVRFGLDSPADRFYVGRDRMSCGLDVPPGTLLLVDDVHNWKIAVPFSAFTDYGVCVIPFILNHFGIAHMEEDRVVRANVRALPWFANGAPICGALTRIFDFWVPLDPDRALEHARELGMPSSKRWFVQTNGVVYWVRDAANGFAYEVDEAYLEYGISVLDVLRMPELKNMPSELVRGRNAYTPLQPGEHWSRPVSPFRALETALYGDWFQRERDFDALSVIVEEDDVFNDAAFATLGIRSVVDEVEGAPQAVADGEQRASPASSSSDDLPDLLPVSDSDESTSGDGYDERRNLFTRIEAFELFMRRTRGDGWADEYFDDIAVFEYESDGAQSA